MQDIIIVRTNPSNPTLAGSYSTGIASDVFISGNYAYVAGDGSLRIIDISDPPNPFYVGSYNNQSLNTDVFVSGNYAYVADRSSGLLILDVTDPSNPTFTGSYATPDFVHDVFVSGSYAHLADSFSGLLIIDVSDPSNPIFAGSYDTPRSTSGVFVADEYTYVAEDYSLMILQFDSPTGIEEINNLPQQFSLEQNYPNPFNPVTTISYSLPIKSQVELVVYNVLSESVTQLINEEKEAGKYNIEFNAAGLPSGVYFYQLRAGDFVDTKKMLLLK